MHCQPIDGLVYPVTVWLADRQNVLLIGYFSCLLLGLLISLLLGKSATWLVLSPAHLGLRAFRCRGECYTFSLSGLVLL